MFSSPKACMECASGSIPYHSIESTNFFKKQLRIFSFNHSVYSLFCLYYHVFLSKRRSTKFCNWRYINYLLFYLFALHKVTDMQVQRQAATSSECELTKLACKLHTVRGASKRPAAIRRTFNAQPKLVPIY